MRKNKIVQCAVAVALTAALPLCLSAQQTLPYTTGFEAPTYSAGSLNGQDNWIVTDGTATVQNTVVQAGSQAVKLDPNSTIDKAFDSGSYSSVWVEGYFRGEGSDGTPSFPSSPPASAIVFFDSTNGIRCYDGKQPGPDFFVNTGDTVSASSWSKVTIKLNFTSKEWDCYVNDTLKLTALGFRDNSVTKFNGFTNFSSKESYLDSFRAIPFILGDGNLDTEVNVGDVILLTNILNGATSTSDAIVLAHLDVAAPSGAPDNADLTGLINLILGK
ncbi:MAG: hypothetical protein Kow0059_11080 [Candidatus Sumerlaeia bacterium]